MALTLPSQSLSIEQLMLLRDHHVNSTEQIIILLTLYEAHLLDKAMKLSELQTLSTQKKSSFFRMVKKLEDEHGWIRTDTNFDDQRGKFVSLTDEAVEMMEEVTQVRYATSSKYRHAI